VRCRKSVASSAFERAAETAVERLGLADGESFLVAYNKELAPIAEAIAEAARHRTEAIGALSFPPLTRNGEEPPDEVTAALFAADAAALVTTFSLSHTQARLAATRKGARIASMPDITADMFARTLPVDYTQLESVGRALAMQLTEAERCLIVAPSGTDVEIVLSGRTGRSDDGDLREPGAFGNLPAGEAYIAPFEPEGSGTIVFDGSLGSWGLLEEPLRIEFDGGRAISTSGGEAASWLLSTLEAGGPNGRVIAEFGVGTNPSATIIGKILEDEKVEGTIHIAFGTNTGIGGANQASVHIDGLVLDPTVELDGRCVMRGGRLIS
jgi:leucyl aminopeptidase (aminopeptidase T)